MYGTVSDADSYFNNERLFADAWINATTAEKTKALKQASNAINRLSFVGTRYDTTDFFNPSTVPADIKKATYECAISLLEGIDVNVEIENIPTVSQGFGNARVTYDRAYVLEHFRAGIPSAVAWNYLKPYLSPDALQIDISRVT
jgi:hypothetical protein